MDAVTENIDLFWNGFLRSLGLCLWGMVGSLLVGTLIASFRVSPVAPLRTLGTAWGTRWRRANVTARRPPP